MTFNSSFINFSHLSPRKWWQLGVREIMEKQKHSTARCTGTLPELALGWTKLCVLAMCASGLCYHRGWVLGHRIWDEPVKGTRLSSSWWDGSTADNSQKQELTGLSLLSRNRLCPVRAEPENSPGIHRHLHDLRGLDSRCSKPVLST